MWHHEHTADTTAPAGAVFAVWADVAGWPSSDASLHSASLDGPFRTGATGHLHPDGVPEPLAFTITDVVDGEGYDDETVMGPVTIRFAHRALPTPEGTQIHVQVSVSGPGEDEIGPAIVSDLPESVAALARVAEARVGRA